MVKCGRINDVPDIIEKGLNELGMTILFIDKIENLESLKDANGITEDVIEEVDLLLNSHYIFKICDKLFPYIERI